MDLTTLLVGFVGALLASNSAAIGFLYRAIQRGDFVPGSIYRAAVERAEKAEAGRDKADRRADKADIQAERNTEALRLVTATVKQALDSRVAPGAPDAPR